MRGAAIRSTCYLGISKFLLTRLMRGAAIRRDGDRWLKYDFYSRASCEARLNITKARKFSVEISTHAPHARRGHNQIKAIDNAKISTHAPHARRGQVGEGETIPLTISTHAPHARRGINQILDYSEFAISTHAPHARRGWGNGTARKTKLISTHAPHARRGFPASSHSAA